MPRKVGKAAYYGLMIGFLAVVISLITLVNELSGLDEAQRYFANAMVFLLAIFGYFQFFKDFDIDARNRRRNKTIEGVDVEKSEELQEFIHSTIESVKKGTPEPYYLHSDIDFEIAVISVKEAKGGFKLLVVDASGKYDKEATTRIKFSIREG